MTESIAPSFTRCLFITVVLQREYLFSGLIILNSRRRCKAEKHVTSVPNSFRRLFAHQFCHVQKITKSDSLDDDDSRLFWLLTLCSRISNIWPSKKRDERDHVGLSRERARAAMTKRRPPNSSQKDKSGESR